jgi:hypothetical protein
MKCKICGREHCETRFDDEKMIALAMKRVFKYITENSFFHRLVRAEISEED